jgi:hypothetical protein
MSNTVRFNAIADSGFDKVQKKLSGVSSAFDKLGGPGSGASLFGNIGAMAVSKGFGLIDTAASAALGVLEDSIRAAEQEEVSIAKLDTALRANVPAWDGNRDAIERVLQARLALGFSDDEQRSSLALLVAATHDASKALEVQRIAMDLARLKGISLEEASNALVKVEGGQYRMLKSLGIVLKDGATQQDALNAVQKVGTGQAESYASTTSGKVLVAQVKVGEAMEKLGTVLLPLVAAAMTGLADVAVPVIEGIGKAVQVVIDTVGALIRGIQRAIDWLGSLNLAQAHTAQEAINYHLTGQVPVSGGGGGGSTRNAVTIQGVSAAQIADMIDRQLYFKLSNAAPTRGNI